MEEGGGGGGERERIIYWEIYWREGEIGAEECEEEEEKKKKGRKNQYLRGNEGGESEGVGTPKVKYVEKEIKNTLWGKRGMSQFQRQEKKKEKKKKKGKKKKRRKTKEEKNEH